MVEDYLLELHSSIMLCFVQCRALPVHHFRECLHRTLTASDLARRLPSLHRLELRNQALEDQISTLEVEFERLIDDKHEAESRADALEKQVSALQEEVTRLEEVVREENRRLLFQRAVSSGEQEEQVLFLSSLTHFQREEGRPAPPQIRHSSSASLLPLI